MKYLKTFEYNSIERLEDSNFDYDEEVMQRKDADYIVTLQQNITSCKSKLHTLTDQLDEYNRSKYKDNIYYVLKSRANKLNIMLQGYQKELSRYMN